MAEPRLSPYEYEQLLDLHARPLLRLRPRQSWELLSRDLRLAAEAERDGVFSIWRSAVEETDQDFMGRPIDKLIGAARDALRSLADADADYTGALVGELLGDPLPIFRRFAFYLVTERPAFLSKVGARLLVPPVVVDFDVFHEQMRLFQEQFAALPEPSREQVHRLMAGDVPSDLIPEGVDPDQFSEHVRWLLLNVLRESALTSEEISEKQRLNSVHGESEHPLFLAWFGGVHAAQSSVDSEFLRRVIEGDGYDGLIEFLRAPGSRIMLRWPWDEDHVWDPLEELAIDSPSEMVHVLKLIDASDFPRARTLLRGYVRVTESGSEIPLDEVLGELSRIVADPASLAALYPVAEFLKARVGNLTLPLTEAHSTAILGLAETVLAASFTPLEEFDRNGDDIATHHVNSPAGFAADVIVSILFRRAVDASTNDERHTLFPDRSRSDPNTFGLLDRSLSTGWGGTELRHAVGKRVQLVVWAKPDWLDQVRDRMLPAALENRETLGAWRAFWTGYLITDRVSDRVMESLRPSYEVLVDDAAAEEPTILRDAFARHDRESLADHIVVGWLRGYAGFGRDGLIWRFIAGATDNLRAYVAHRLTNERSEAKRSTDVEWSARVMSELDAYWTGRITALREEPHSGAKELEAFSLWLPERDEGLSSLSPALELMAERIEPFGSEQLVAYVERFAAAEPADAVALASAMVNRWLGSTEFFWSGGRHIPDLVEVLWRTVDAEAEKVTLRRIVNDLLEVRGIDLRSQIGVA